MRLEAHGSGQGYSARSFLACSRAPPSNGSLPHNRNVNHNGTCHPGGRCAAAPKHGLATLLFAGQNTRLEKILHMQGEYQRGRAQVVEAYREIAASTTNSRQGQYITTTSGIMIRRRGGMRRAIRSASREASIPTAMSVVTRYRILTQTGYRPLRFPRHRCQRRVDIARCRGAVPVRIQWPMTALAEDADERPRPRPEAVMSVRRTRKILAKKLGRKSEN